MKVEDIKQEAQNRCDKRFSYLHNSVFFDGFVAGAKWRINSVWHDVKEEPKYDEYFLYENVVHAYHVDGIYPSEDEPFVWDDYVKDMGLLRWVYIKDLIPNTKE